MRGRRLGLTLSWLWLALAIVYLAWSWTEQAGLLYWLGTLEVDRLGTYLSTVNGIVSVLLLLAPALLYMGLAAPRRQLPAPPDPAATARAARKVSLTVIGLGVLGYIIGVTCFIAALCQPNGSERAMPFDAARLGSGPTPDGMVSLHGRTHEAAQAILRDSSRGSTWTTTYTGFRTPGEVDNAPLQVFVERRINGEADPAGPDVAKVESGYLIENGLPPLIRYTLEHQGVRIATPHYLLRSSSALRLPYFVGAGLGVLFGFMLTAIGALLLVLPRRGLVRSRP